MELRNKINLPGFFFLFTLIALSSCSQEFEYKQKVKKELAKGIRQDTLFLGFSFGMTSEQFYNHCLNLNKKGTVQMGTSNSAVYYEMEEFDPSVEVNFLPTFFNDKIYEMPIRYNYKSWSPWNKSLISDSLLVNLLGWYKKQYGPEFMTIQSKDGINHYKIDGNRQISIYRKDDLFVEVMFTDLLAKEEIKGY